MAESAKRLFAPGDIYLFKEIGKEGFCLILNDGVLLITRAGKKYEIKKSRFIPDNTKYIKPSLIPNKVLLALRAVRISNNLPGAD